MKKYVILFFLLFIAGVGAIYAQEDTVKNTSQAIDNFVLNQEVSMYPNPVERYLTIRSTQPITRVQIFSLLGDLIMDENKNFNRMDLYRLNSGIYMIKIHSNQFHITKKLVKK
ncbi:T9SS type A sorting domain-containing protein [Lutimonas saemankumensis]|uniref:T9SS type A sorting domain-containing protein n=1 Tax=Lutimonas saemankumensis TaxID=483016 RepID=UPI001CD2A5F2|nr:T9SS type A sorting domain-containing protein [Lutimonas saemankumensis]MCA0933340.1 T9SS type A sorting domain-containing protein [Lutimonas saemankumensis]